MSDPLDEINRRLAEASNADNDRPIRPVPTTRGSGGNDDSVDGLLDDLAASGVTVEVSGDRLRLSPASRVNDALAARVRRHKAAILSRLTAGPLGLAPTTLWQQAIAAVAESLKIPPDVLEAANAARVQWVPAARLKDR